MPKIISNERFAYFSKADIRFQRLITAHRWLSEFDWLLGPMWDYLTLETYFGDIDSKRSDMRKRLEEKLGLEKALTKAVELSYKNKVSKLENSLEEAQGKIAYLEGLLERKSSTSLKARGRPKVVGTQPNKLGV